MAKSSNTKKAGSFEGKSKLEMGGRAAQLRAKGVPGGVIGEIARKKQAAPGQKNSKGGSRCPSGWRQYAPPNIMRAFEPMETSHSIALGKYFAHGSDIRRVRFRPTLAIRKMHVTVGHAQKSAT